MLIDDSPGGWWLTPHPYTPAVKRWPLRIILYLMLGAITTVAVAWGAGVSNDLLEAPMTHGHTLYASGWGWYIKRADAVASSWVSSWSSAMDYDFGVEPAASDVAPYWCRLECLDPTVEATWSAQARGWPLRALWCDFEALADAGPGETVGGGIRLAPAGFAAINTLHALPLRPIWPGFVIDTLFYAAIWFGVFFGFASAKRAIQRRRGRCPRCGYDLRGQLEEVRDQKSEVIGARAGCPECGWGRAAR